MNYPVIYSLSFVIFWGMALVTGLFVGGLLTLSLVLMMLLVLISHEHAHLKECERLNVHVNGVTFTWVGGMVDSDIRYANDAVPILFAGVVNTGCYAITFVSALVVLYLIRPIGMNFVQNPYLDLLFGIVSFLIVMVITNVLPIEYHHEKHGIISTDGWATIRFMELRDELWNEGKYLADLNAGG